MLPFGFKQASRWAYGSEGFCGHSATLKHVHEDFLVGDFETKSAAQPLIASLQEIETSFAQVGTKTNQGIRVLLHGTIEIQLEKPTIESIIFEDLAVKPPILVGQLVGMLDIGFECFKTKGARQHQWQINWASFSTFRWRIVLLPFWIWDELWRDFSIRVYHSHKTNRILLFVGLFQSSFHSTLPIVGLLAVRCSFSTCFSRTRGRVLFHRRGELI